ncbi:MAG: hypothetical protein ACXW3K_01065 [Brevundimonas sp.]
MAGEQYENVAMYIDFAAQAEAAGDLRAASLSRQIVADEGEHYEPAAGQPSGFAGKRQGHR